MCGYLRFPIYTSKYPTSATHVSLCLISFFFSHRMAVLPPFLWGVLTYFYFILVIQTCFFKERTIVDTEAWTLWKRSDIQSSLTTSLFKPVFFQRWNSNYYQIEICTDNCIKMNEEIIEFSVVFFPRLLWRALVLNSSRYGRFG